MYLSIRDQIFLENFAKEIILIEWVIFFGSHGAIKKDETGLVCNYGNVRLPNTEETKWVLWKHGILKIAYKVQDDFTLNIKYCIPCLMLTSMRRALNKSRWFCGSKAVEK